MNVGCVNPGCTRRDHEDDGVGDFLHSAQCTVHSAQALGRELFGLEPGEVLWSLGTRALPASAWVPSGVHQIQIVLCAITVTARTSPHKPASDAQVNPAWSGHVCRIFSEERSQLRHPSSITRCALATSERNLTVLARLLLTSQHGRRRLQHTIWRLYD